MRLPLAVLALGAFSSIVAPEGCAQAHCDPDRAEEPIARELAHEADKARTWRYVWTGLNAGSALLSLAAIPILPKSDRPDLIIGAATSAVSGAFTWFWPLDVEADAEAAPRSRCWPRPARRADLLRLRLHSARDEAERIRWPWHVGNLVTALIPGAVLWFGYHQQLNGALSVAGSFASGEIELLTQPTHLADEPPELLPVSVTPILMRGGVLLTVQQSW